MALAATDTPATYDPNGDHLLNNEVQGTGEYAIMPISATLETGNSIPRERLRGTTDQPAAYDPDGDQLLNKEIQGSGEHAIMPISAEVSTIATWAKAHKLLNTIDLDAVVTRAQASQIFVTLLKSYNPDAPMTMKLCPFGDITGLARSAQNYIQDACALLFFNGYADGNFQPHWAITQEEFKIVLTRFAKESDKDLVNQVVKNKALLPSLTQEQVFHYLATFMELAQTK